MSFKHPRCRACDRTIINDTAEDSFFCSISCGYMYGTTIASAIDATKALLLPPSPFDPRGVK